MKKTFYFAMMIVTLVIATTVAVCAQEDYKHPQLNAEGHVLDSTGTKLGWIKDGVIFNAKGEEVGKIEKGELVDYKGHKLGKVAKDGTFYDEKGVMIFTVEPNSKGEKCKLFDPKGKVVATVHENYKNQACTIHCLSTKMPKH